MQLPVLRVVNVAACTAFRTSLRSALPLHNAPSRMAFRYCSVVLGVADKVFEQCRSQLPSSKSSVLHHRSAADMISPVKAVVQSFHLLLCILSCRGLSFCESKLCQRAHLDFGRLSVFERQADAECTLRSRHSEKCSCRIRLA